MTTFGMEFEIQGVSVDKAYRVLNEGGVECERPNATHVTSQNWKAVYDGSVSNGAEVVSPILNENRLNEAVTVTKILKSAGARVDRATGFHVHVGLSAFSNSEAISRFVLNYYSMHGSISALVAPSRLRNRYTAILNRNLAEKEAEGVREGQLRSSLNRTDLVNLGINDQRYCSLNLQAIDRHATLEVRLHQGTLNGVKAIAWSKFIAGLIKISNKGVELHDNPNLNPWLDPRGRDSATCATLLDTLVNWECLNASTADWLKVRARKLQG